MLNVPRLSPPSASSAGIERPLPTVPTVSNCQSGKIGRLCLQRNDNEMQFRGLLRSEIVTRGQRGPDPGEAAVCRNRRAYSSGFTYHRSRGSLGFSRHARLRSSCDIDRARNRNDEQDDRHSDRDHPATGRVGSSAIAAFLRANGNGFAAFRAFAGNHLKRPAMGRQFTQFRT